MKKIVLFSLMAFFVGRIIAQNNIQSIPVGSQATATDIKMKEVVGKSISIKNAMDKNGVLVMFSCNTCPYVIKNQARTTEIADYAKKNGFGVIIINSNEAQRGSADSYDAMKSYAKEQKYLYNYYYAVDENAKVADAFGATRTPEIFLLDATGKVLYKGAIDDNPSEPENVKRHHAKEAIDEVASGKEVTVKESKSVGCSIKRKS